MANFSSRLAFAIEERLELAGARRAGAPLAQKLDEQQFEKPQLERADALVFHERGCAQRGNLGLHRRRIPQSSRAAAAREILHALDVEIQEILVERAVRKVRAGVERPAIVDGVQRIERHETGIELFGGEIHHLQQIAEVAAAPVARRADSVQADRDARGTATAAQVRRNPGTLGSYDIADRSRHAPDVDGNLVIAERQADRQPRHFAHSRAAVHLDVRGLRQLPKVQLKLAALPVLTADNESRPFSQRLHGNVEAKFLFVRFGAHYRGRRQTLPFAARECGQGMFQLAGVLRRGAQRLQDGLFGGGRGVVIAAPNIPVAWLDARQGCGAVE